MLVPTRAGGSAKWRKSKELKGLAWRMEMLSAVLFETKSGVGLP
jgi:hypothetical protein